MTRTVTLVAIIGIATAAVCLPLAALLGHGNEYAGWGWSGASGWHMHVPWSGRWFDEDGFSDDGAAQGSIVSRDFAWNGGDKLQLDVPGTLHFQPAPQWHLSIRGHSGTLDRIEVDNGRIRLRHSYRGAPSPVDVQLSGPGLSRIELNGSGDLVLDKLKQDSLDVAIRGSGSASATGSVDTLRVEIMGSGSARLAQLAAHSARIFIAGSGNADITPSDAADIFIAGSGDVRLHSHPKRLSSRVAGSGRVSEVPGGQDEADQGGESRAGAGQAGAGETTRYQRI